VATGRGQTCGMTPCPNTPAAPHLLGRTSHGVFSVDHSDHQGASRDGKRDLSRFFRCLQAAMWSNLDTSALREAFVCRHDFMAFDRVPLLPISFDVSLVSFVDAVAQRMFVVRSKRERPAGQYSSPVLPTCGRLAVVRVLQNRDLRHVGSRWTGAHTQPACHAPPASNHFRFPPSAAVSFKNVRGDLLQILWGWNLVSAGRQRGSAWFGSFRSPALDETSTAPLLPPPAYSFGHGRGPGRNGGPGPTENPMILLCAVRITADNALCSQSCRKFFVAAIVSLFFPYI
jgi:hypothetical protein